MAQRFRASIAVGAEVHGYVTVALHNVTLDQALTAVLAPLGYTAQRRNGIYLVRSMPRSDPSSSTVSQSPGTATAVLPITLVPLDHAAATLRALYPQANIRVDRSSNAVVVTASAEDMQAMRAVLQGLDVRNPAKPSVEAISLQTPTAARIVQRIAALFPNARLAVASPRSLIIRATSEDLTQIKTLVTTLDAPSATPAPGAVASEGVRVTQRAPADIARALARQFPRLRVSVSGSSVLLAGPPEDVARAKTLSEQIDIPPFGSRYTDVYRIRTFDAGSVSALISRSFPSAQVSVDRDLNALSVTASTSDQRRIGDAIAQLDTTPAATTGAGAGAPVAAAANVEIVTLRSAVPQAQGGAAADAQNGIVQALQSLVPDVHVVNLPTAGQIALTGNPQSLRVAKEFLAKADVPAPLVVLDTEVLELDETVARNLGLQFTQPVISTTFSELSPIDTGNGTPRLIGLQPITRSPLSLGVQLNLLIQRGTARVLADPRITTLSGRTATIRAGDTIGILTTVGGGVGTATTTQLQTFQTGVTLDITPIVADDDITVALHPVVNSLSGILNGVPQIATRDAQTTVHLKDNQTLIIGGLIQESNNRTETKVPILGDLPAIGSIFRNQQVNNTRNELIVVVTPHILLNGATAPPASPPLPAIPTPQPLPTLPPRTALPAARPFVARTPIPQRTPSNLLSTAPPPAPLTLPSASPSVVPSPGTSGKPSSTPMPTPSAFAQANTYTYGQAPQSTFAKPTDPVQVFFASLSPTILSAGATVRVNAITTSNAQRVTLIAGSTSTQLTQVGPGQWQGAFPFPASGSTVGQTTLQLSLSASRQDGTSASIAIPVNVSP